MTQIVLCFIFRLSDIRSSPKMSKKDTLLHVGWKISSTNPLRQIIILLIFLGWKETKPQILQSIYFCLPTKNKTKQKKQKKHKFSNPNSYLNPPLAKTSYHIDSPILPTCQHHATEVPTKAAATGAVSETGCGTEGIPVATAAATAWAALVATLWPWRCRSGPSMFGARLGPRTCHRVTPDVGAPNEKNGEGGILFFKKQKETPRNLWLWNLSKPLFWGWHLLLVRINKLLRHCLDQWP